MVNRETRLGIMAANLVAARSNGCIVQWGEPPRPHRRSFVSQDNVIKMARQVTVWKARHWLETGLFQYRLWMSLWRCVLCDAFWYLLCRSGCFHGSGGWSWFRASKPLPVQGQRRTRASGVPRRRADDSRTAGHHLNALFNCV